MDLENKSSCRHQEENPDGCSSSENPGVLKDDGTGISEHLATYRRGQFGDRAIFGTRYFSSEEYALEELLQAKTINDASVRSVEHASSGLTSSTSSISLARQSPPVQTMERGAGYDLDRISSSMFERSASGTALEWSAASSESLFSLKIGNASFTIDHDIILSGDQRKSEEKPGELVGVTPPPTIQMDETEGSKAVIGRKSRTTAKVVDDSLKEHVKEARDERFYTPRTSWDSSRASNHSYKCTTSTNSTSKRTWSFCCFTGLSCSWGSCCCKMRSCGCSDFSCSFCSRSRQNYCTCNEQGELCSNLSCGSLCCCSGKACSSCSLKSLCCCSGKACSSCSLKPLCCCSGKGCSGCRLKSLCCCSGKACSSCRLKSLCCCSGKGCSNCRLKLLCCCSGKGCSSCSLKSLCCCSGKGCSNCSLKSLCCCSGKGCSSCSLKSLCCCSGKGCSSCSLKSLCCCSGKGCSSCSFKSLCCCSGKGCSSCSFKSLSCCSETTCTPGICSNCWRGCWNCSCCRNKSCSSKCCG